MTAKKKNRRKSSPKKPTPPTTGLRWRLPLLFGLTALLCAQVVSPSDASVEQGDGVVLIMFWLLLLCGWAVAQLRSATSVVRWGWIDSAVLALVAWHTLSALVAIDRASPRPAINTLWQWMAMGICFFLARQLVCKAVEARALVVVMTGLAVGISLVGFSQYFVTMPQDRAIYEEIKDNPQEMFKQAGRWYPAGSVERRQFENRLYSTEPFGTFAMTNSLAGFLAPWLIVLLGVGFSGTQHKAGRGAAPAQTLASRMPVMIRAGGLALPIVGCLLLTKSRSGYLAVLAGAVLLFVTLRPARAVSKRQLVLVTVILLLLLALVVSVAITAGGLDQAVLTEAGKSLGYRWQYWQSTLAMIGDHLWLGCGPGQFQDAYARYKLPEASEDIKDPHNFLLEIWATAGTPALAAMVVILVFLMVYAVRAARHRDNSVEKADTTDSRAILFIVAGANGGVLLGMFTRTLVGFPLDWIGLALCLIGMAGSVMLLRNWLRDGNFVSLLPAVGAVVLLINLSAAGGISYPGVAGTFWLLLALLLVALPCNLHHGNLREDDRGKQSSPTERHGSKRFAWIRLTVIVGLTIAFYSTEYSPVLLSRSLLERAAAAPMSKRESLLVEAFRADPFSHQAARHLAAQRFAEWQHDPTDLSLAEYQQAEQDVLRLAPGSRTACAQSGRRLTEIYDVTQDEEHLRGALAAHRRATELYPHNALVRAELAGVLLSAGHLAEARDHAREALRQDDITRQAGHADKLLPDEQRGQMQRIVSQSGE